MALSSNCLGNEGECVLNMNAKKMATNVCWKRYCKHNLLAFLGSKPAFTAPDLIVEDL